MTDDLIRDRFNWYQYCDGDPVNWVDLWGLVSAHIKFPEELKTSGYDYSPY